MRISKTNTIILFTVIGLIIILTTILLYFIVINPNITTEIDGKNYFGKNFVGNKKVNGINESNFKDIIGKTRKKFTILNLWSYQRNCFGSIDTELITLSTKYTNINFVFLNVDLNSNNNDMLINSYLKENNFQINAYKLDKKATIFDMENRSNLFDFLRIITNNKHKYLEDYSYYYLFDNKGNFIKEIKNINNVQQWEVFVDSLSIKNYGFGS